MSCPEASYQTFDSMSLYCGRGHGVAVRKVAMVASASGAVWQRRRSAVSS